MSTMPMMDEGGKTYGLFHPGPGFLRLLAAHRRGQRKEVALEFSRTVSTDGTPE